MEGDRSAVPALLRDHVAASDLPASFPNPDSIMLSRWRLRFLSKDGLDLTYIARAFYARNATRFIVPVRVTTVIFLFLNIMLIGYDVLRFGTAFGNNPNLLAALVIRLAIMTPVCAGIFIFSYFRTYLRWPHLLAIPYAILGGCLIAYSIQGQNPGYGTLALFIVYIFSFSPLPFFAATGVTVLLIVAFGISLERTRDQWVQRPGNLDAGTTSTGDFGEQVFNILGVLCIFFFIVAFIGHNLEHSLKRAFLDELRLQLDTLSLKAEKSLSASLLNTMLPPQIISRLQHGTAIEDSVPELTVLFCELDLDTSRFPAATIVTILNIAFTAFDAHVDETLVRKIETVACVWLGVSSPFLAPDLAGNHAIYAAELALKMAASMPSIREAIKRETGLDEEGLIDFRIGLNSGPVAAGVVGIKNPR